MFYNPVSSYRLVKVAIKKRMRKKALFKIKLIFLEGHVRPILLLTHVENNQYTSYLNLRMSS